MPTTKQTRLKTTRRLADQARGVECPGCGAATGELCWGDFARQIRTVHLVRLRRFERATGLRKKLRGNVKVSFVCPICGGPHARADHV